MNWSKINLKISDNMKNVVVIGGSQGIGKAIINELKNDFHIVNISRTKIDSHENINHFNSDVLKDELPEIDMDIHGLVYCPGSINLKSFERLTLDDFQNDFDINVVGAIKVLKTYINNLKKNQGSVVMFSTVATQLGMPFHSSIAMSKSAVEGLVKSLAAEYATKVRFNCIAPTITNTPLAARLLRNEQQMVLMENRHPLKKILEPKEVASLACYLLGENSNAISGQIFPMDAGLVSLKV